MTCRHGLVPNVGAMVRPLAQQTLSVVCLTDGPPERVARSLSLLRDVADEIVVAFDSRLDPSAARRLAEVADTIVRFEYAPPLERSLAWLHSLCSMDWILRVDSDEIVSNALIEALPDLIADANTFQYWLPTRWLYPDDAHWIKERPWWPDFHSRLVRNDPAVIRVEGRLHTSLMPRQPYRFVEFPIYHLDCVVNPLEARRAKVERYEQQHPGLTGEGRSVNVPYLPETFITRAPVAVPPEDVAMIRAVIDASPSEPQGRVPVESQLVGRDEIDGYWNQRPLCDDDYAAEIEPWDVEPCVVSGQLATFYVAVVNRGGFTWMDQPDDVRLTYRWWKDGDMVVADGLRSTLPSPIRPGERTLLQLQVKGPENGGAHVLAVDLVHEGIRWFGSDCRIDVDVRPAPSQSEV